MTTNDDTELRKQLLEHFIDGAPSYAVANEYQQAHARLKTDEILPLIHQYGNTRAVEATNPPLDLNAYENQLQSQVSDIDAFNLFIKKWCPRASHLLDSDDNDGQYIRDRIKALTQTPREEQ